MNLNELTIKEAVDLLKEGKISSFDLTKSCLEAAKKNKDLNAYITLCEKEALAGAKESDQRRKKGKLLSNYDGIPLAVKDNISTSGIKTTAGSKILENFIPPYDAFVIEKIKKAGMIILGKTNLDEFAMGSSTETSYFRPTKNPIDKTRVPGGSSGGSATAVASDQCLAALGSDTGGSIRQPASFCGVIGFKPTYGAVSRYGLLAMASSLDQIGPLTKTVGDAKILFEIISGRDERDSTSIELKSKIKNSFDSAQDKQKSKINELKIGVPKEYFVKGIEEETEKAVKEAIKNLEKIGAKIIDVSLPHTEYALACYYIIMPSEASTNLARYDGIKYGYSTAQSPKLRAQSLLDVYLKSRAKGFGNEVKRRIMLGTYSLSAGYIAKYYLKAAKVRTLIKKDFDEVFKKVGLLITPTSPTTAFKLGEKLEDPIKMYLSDIFTVPVNLAGLPAISVPAGKDKKGLPVGLQIIGPQWSEEKILNLASQFETISNN